MPQFALIDRSAIPSKQGGGRDSIALFTARNNLQHAAKENKAIQLTLARDERATKFIKIYRAAAATFNVALIITSGELRTFTNRNGKETREASVLYIVLTKPAAKAPAAIQAVS